MRDIPPSTMATPQQKLSILHAEGMAGKLCILENEHDAELVLGARPARLGQFRM
jgi:hypothetical protein